MRQQLNIEGRLDGMNEFIAAINSNRHKGNDLKHQNEAIVSSYIKKSGLKPVTCKQDFTFCFIEKFPERGRARDKDNISGGARKFILDALVKEGILPDDGWKWIGHMSDIFYRASGDGAIKVVMTDSDHKDTFVKVVH